MSGDRWGLGGPDDHSTYAPIAAPTPQPDTEHVTAAVERAERALVETWHGTIGCAFHPARFKEARATLAAALNVDEMARVLLPYIGTFEGLAPGEQEFRRNIARNIRAALLGGAA